MYDSDRSRCQLGVAGIALRQPLGDGEAVAVRLERAGKVALLHLHVANFIVRH